MRNIALRITIIFAIITLVSLAIQTENKPFLERALAKSSNSTISAYYCGYQNITSVFQKNGMPSRSTIKSIEKINDQYMSLFLYNNITNNSELYFYDLGNDLRLNTNDDRGFLIDRVYGENQLSVLLVNQGVNKLYWVKPLPPRGTGTGGAREIKSCTLTNQGCINSNVVSYLPNAPPYVDLQAMMISPQNRIYLVYDNYYQLVPRLTSAFISCSMQRGVADSCNGPMLNFTVHSTFTHSLRRNINGMGFITIYPPPLEFARPIYFFDIRSSNPGMILLPPGLYTESISTILTPSITAIQQSSTNLNDSLVMIDSTNNVTFLEDIGIQLQDPLSQPSLDFQVFIDSTPTGIITIHHENNIMAKKNGQETKLIYNYTSSTEPRVIPKLVLPDSTILGYIPSRKSIVQFICRP